MRQHIADKSVDLVYAARSEYRIVLATMPLPARPMGTYTGFDPGTVTLRTRIEYIGEVAGQAVRPCRSRQRPLGAVLVRRQRRVRILQLIVLDYLIPAVEAPSGSHWTSL